MRPRNINVQDDIYDKLKQEDNVSQLINDLLRKYYISQGETKEDLVNKERKIIDEIQLFKKNKELELNRVQLEVKKIESIELTEEQKKEKNKLKQEEKEMYIQQVAEEEIHRRLTRQELDQYFYDMSNNKTNIYMFLDTLREVK
jgi:hypothetical protein